MPPCYIHVISYPHLGCRTDQESLQEYDEEVHEGKSAAKSMQDLVTGRYCVCHKLLGQQTSSQTSPKIPNTAVDQKE